MATMILRNLLMTPQAAPALHQCYTIAQPKHNTATAAIKSWKFLMSSHAPVLHHCKNTTWQPPQQNHGIFPCLHTRACATHISPNTTQQPPQQKHGNLPCLTCACTTPLPKHNTATAATKLWKFPTPSSHLCLCYTITQPKHNTATAATKSWKFPMSSHPHLRCATHIGPNTTWQLPQQNHGNLPCFHVFTPTPVLHYCPNTTWQLLQQNHGNFPCLHTRTHLYQPKHMAMACCNKITWKLSHVFTPTLATTAATIQSHESSNGHNGNTEFSHILPTQKNQHNTLFSKENSEQATRNESKGILGHGLLGMSQERSHVIGHRL